MDKAGWHRSHDLKVPDNIILLYLPPYSPQLNPVEELWKEMREKFFKNYMFKSIEAVVDQLEQACIAFENNKKYVQSIAAFPWIINAILKAT